MRSKKLCDIIQNALKEIRTLCPSPGSVMKSTVLATCNFSRKDFQSVKLRHIWCQSSNSSSRYFQRILPIVPLLDIGAFFSLALIYWLNKWLECLRTCLGKQRTEGICFEKKLFSKVIVLLEYSHCYRALLSKEIIIGFYTE